MLVGLLALAGSVGLLAGCAGGSSKSVGRSPSASPSASAPAERAPSAPAAADPGRVPSPPVPGDAFAATVIRVVDGDTVLAAVAGSSTRVRVRLIGVDTPESVKPNTPVACYGPEAAALAHRLLTDRPRVRAAYEPGGLRDRFGRELWDVWLSDGRFLQAVLVAAGAARAYPYRPQVRYAEPLRRLAAAARAQRRGLWGPPCNGQSFGL